MYAQVVRGLARLGLTPCILARGCYSRYDRPAEELDVPALVRLLRRSWLVTWVPELPFEAVQAFAAADPARSHAETAWRTFVVATRSSMLVGMAQTDHDVIESLDVYPACWNGGVGSTLLHVAERQIARSYAVARLEVRSFNTRALTFYARRGWAEVQRYPRTECGSPVENVEMQITGLVTLVKPFESLLDWSEERHGSRECPN
jgi:N-acetylglutamate synthase-like GNAT family acetyltransferase